MNLPEPNCELGYPDDQLREIMGDRYDELNRWMRGQTIAICDGRRYDHGQKKYVPTGCGPHGPVVYKWDVERFVRGLPVID